MFKINSVFKCGFFMVDDVGINLSDLQLLTGFATSFRGVASF